MLTRRIGRPHAATSCFTSATVASPSWKIDAASAACAPAASAAAMSAGPPAPPEAMTGTRTAAVTAAIRLEVVSGVAAVGVDARDEQLAGAALDRLARPLDRVAAGGAAAGRGVRLPAAVRARRVDGHHDALGAEAGGELRHELGPVERRRC